MCKKINEIAKTRAFENSHYVGAVTWGLYGSGERMKKKNLMRLSWLILKDINFQPIAAGILIYMVFMETIWSFPLLKKENASYESV